MQQQCVGSILGKVIGLHIGFTACDYCCAGGGQPPGIEMERAA